MSHSFEPRPILTPSPNFDFRSSRTIDTLILQATGSNDGLGDVARRCNPTLGISSHYVVDRNGKVYQLVADKDRAWFTGSPRDEHLIGVELVNDGSGRTPYPRKQYRALKGLVSALIRKHPIKLENLEWYEPFTKACATNPCTRFDFGRIHQRAASAIERKVEVEQARLRQGDRKTSHPPREFPPAEEAPQQELREERALDVTGPRPPGDQGVSPEAILHGILRSTVKAPIGRGLS